MSDQIQMKEETPAKKKPATNSKAASILKKIDSDTAKLIQSIKDKANKKSFGRKVRDGEIISLGVKQLTAEHIKQLQEATLNQRDRLQMHYEEYQRSNGKMSFDDFIGKLLKGEVITRLPESNSMGEPGA